MCGACGGGGRAGPLWEDAAGRVDAAGTRARLGAVRRLASGTRWQVRPWHGSWVAVGPSGRSTHLGSLDELFGMLPRLRVDLAPGQPPEVAEVPPPPGWHVQAALVWVAAARAAGLTATCALPVDADGALCIDLRNGHLRWILRQDGDPRVRVTAASAPALLGSLLATVGVPAGGRADRQEFSST